MRAILALSVASTAAGFIIPNQQQLSPQEKSSYSSLDTGFLGPDSFMSYVSAITENVEYLIKGRLFGTDSARMERMTSDEGDIEYYNSVDDEYPVTGIRSRESTAGRHGPRNLTIYEMIQASKHATVFAKLVSEFDDIVDYLNSTSKSHTVFVPIDEAFEKFKHHPEVPKEVLKRFVEYHISSDIYPVQRIFASRTIPTKLRQSELGQFPQRISTQFGLRGLTLNFYNRIIKSNVRATNGMIHGMKDIFFPPLLASDTLNFISSSFTTFEFGLTKTGLFEVINDTSTHTGATIFAPTNLAFKKLGPKVNGFLFSRWGEKYLTALLKYHIVLGETLYSDAYNKPKDEDFRVDSRRRITHIDLPTLLSDHHLSIDIAHVSRFFAIKINGFIPVATPDLIVKDGAIHVINSVLIPPHKPHGSRGRMDHEDKRKSEGPIKTLPFYEDEDEAVSPRMSLDELIARLEPYVEN